MEHRIFADSITEHRISRLDHRNLFDEVVRPL